MAQTKRKRKHRGTQAGTVERAGATHASRRRPQNRAEARDIARQRRAERLDRPPTWRGALNRAAIAAAVFGVLVILAFQRPIVEGVTLAAVMLLVYIPMSYFTDTLIYNRRQRKKKQQQGR